MMISEALNAKLNEQIKHEFDAAYSYLAMACYFETHSLEALAARFREQSDEEREHAMKIVDYLLETGARVTLAPLDAPKHEYNSPADAIATALSQEKTVTEQINTLVDLAKSENDHASCSFLQWFVDEQVEEVSSMSHLLEIARMAGDNLLNLDAYVRHMAKKD